LRVAVAETGDSLEPRGRGKSVVGNRSGRGAVRREQRELFRVITVRTEPRAKKARLITDVASTALGKKKWWCACRLSI
jgi:hypothetical protein